MARKKNLDEINSAAEKKTGNSVKSRSTNTVQNPTSTTKKDIQEIRSTVNNLKSLSSYQKKRTSTANNQVVESTKKTDEEIIKEYESIPNHNILSRGFSGVSTPGAGRPATQAEIDYNRKQELKRDYQQAKNRQIANFLSANNISDSTLSSLSSKHQSSGKNTRVSDYNRIKKLADAAGIDMKDVINYGEASAAQSTKEALTDYADKHGVIGTVASVPMNILGTVENLKTEAGNYLSGKPIGSNEAVNARSDMAGNIRNAVSENIENPIGKLVYNVGTSIADYAALMPLGSGLALAGMGAEAASGTLNDMKDKNVTPNQMMGTAATSGLIEVLTEKIPLENLFKVAKSGGKQTVKQIIGNVLKQAGVEGTEEGISELANAFADNVINQDESDWNQSINQYMLYGMTQSQAENQARKDLAGRALQSALTGAVSGGIMAGGASAFANANSNIITPEQFQANEEYIQNLKNINEGNNYLDSYNDRVAQDNAAKLEPLNQQYNSSNEKSYEYENMLERVKAVPRTDSVQGDSFVPTHYENGNGVEQYSDHDATNLTSQKGFTSRDKSFSDFVTESLSGSYGKDTMNYYLGTVSEELANDIYNKTGFDVEDFNIHMSSDNIVHAYKEHSDANVESKKNQVALNADLISKLPQVFDNPDNISLSSNTDGRGRKVIMFEKRINGKIIVAEAISGGKHRLSLDTMYIKNSHPTGVDATNTPQPLRPEQSVGKAMEADNTASISDSIPNSGENVNEGQKSYTSRTALNSFLNSEMVKRAKQNLEVFQKEIDNEKFNVDRVSESQSIEKAAENISKDYESVVSRLKNTDTLHSGVETDEAMMILDKMLSDAEHTGDYANVLDWAKMVVNKAHNVGQALQAFAKYSRTPEGTIIKAQQIINAQAEAFYNNNPNARNDMQKTTEQLWEELENAQSNIDKMMPLEQDGNYKSVDVEGIVRKVLQENRFIRKMDDNSINNVADYISKQIRRGADHNQISEDIQNYAATGLFGLDETDVQTVMDILGKAETMPDSKERYDLEQTAIDILADKVCNTSFMDKLNSWRYLSMLGNIRTHIRNVLGNNLNSMTTGVKNNVAAVLEAVYQKAGGKIDRTKTVLNPVLDKSLIDAGRNDAMTNVYSILKDGGSNYSNMLNRIESSKTIYQIKFLESVRKLNNNALEVEDFIGLKNKYATSIAGYLKANGRDASIFDSKEKVDIDFLNEAREYAIEEAKKATFHEYSAFASWISKTSNSLKNSSNPLAKLGHVMIEGNVAFKKTPANILKQGFEYATGPIEMAKGVYQLCNSVKKGKYTASQAIDTFSKGMTGSAIMGLGAFLASMGLITGASSDDKKDSKFDDLTGGQNYALKIGDKSYTIDWLAPFALPLFVGVGLQNNFSSTGKGSVGDVLSDIAAPMLEMTMLDGLSSTLERVRYSDDAWDAAKSIVSTSVANYANQLFPTVGGHFARAIDSTRRTTTPDREGVAGDIEYAVNKIKNKIPFLSMTNEPYVDAWGNTEENTGGNLFGRLAYNMLSPGYYSEQSYDEVENYLSELRKDTDNSNVFPSNAERSVYTEDGKIKLSGADYTKYAKEKGNLQHSVLSSIFASKDYEKLTDDQKVELVNSAYSASGKISQSSIGYNPKDMTMPELYEEIGADGIAKYLIIKQKSSEDDISEYDAIESSDLSSDEKGYFIDKMLKPSESKVSALKKHNDVMEKYGYEGLYTYYTIKSRVDENDTSNASKFAAVDSVNISDEDKGYYLSKMVDVSKAASEIQNSYGDAGLYTWYSLRSKADSDGNGNISNAEMVNQIVQSDLSYDDMLNYASVLYEDGKEKTAREKAADALQKAQDNLSSYQLRQTIKSLRKSYEDENAKKEQSIQNNLSNVSGGSSYGGLLEYIKELRKSRSGGSDLISHIESLRKEYNSSQNSNPLTPIGIQ